MQAAEQTIARIDTMIDANRRALMSRLHFNPDCSSRAWQNAWDRCPDLQAHERELFRQRGAAQVVRDADAHAAWKREQRRIRAEANRAHKIHSPAEVGRKAYLTSRGAPQGLNASQRETGSLGANSSV